MSPAAPGRRWLDANAPAPPDRGFQVVDAACTDTGDVRTSNEDAYVRRPEAGLWAVADGMGGHDGGEWASDAIAQAVAAMPVAGDLDEDHARLVEAVNAANRTIRLRSEASGLRIGSTVVALLLRGPRFAVVWAGDSRAYRLRDGNLVQLTRDHTQVQDRVDRGQLSPEQAWRHPMAHVLTRAVGVDDALALASSRGDVRRGDAFLLCSDGLHGVVGSADIGRALALETPQTACEALLALCRAEGAPDNVTMVGLTCLDPADPLG